MRAEQKDRHLGNFCISHRPWAHSRRPLKAQDPTHTTHRRHLQTQVPTAVGWVGSSVEMQSGGPRRKRENRSALQQQECRTGASLQRLTPDVTLIDSGFKSDWTGIPFRDFCSGGRGHVDGDRLGTARRGEEEADLVSSASRPVAVRGNKCTLKPPQELDLSGHLRALS